MCLNIDFLNHLKIILRSTTYLHTNFPNISTIYKWQWCEFSKSIPFITAVYFLVLTIFNNLSYIKDFILFVSLCTFIVNCVSLYQVSPAQIWVASWICELFRPKFSKQWGRHWFETPSHSLLRHLMVHVVCVVSRFVVVVHQTMAPLSQSDWSAPYRGQGSPVKSWILLKASNGQQASGVGDKDFFPF